MRILPELEFLNGLPVDREALNESIEELFDEPTVFLPVALERTPISLQTNSMKIDTQELSSSEEIQVVYEKSKNLEPQIGTNIEKVKVLLKRKLLRRNLR